MHFAWLTGARIGGIMSSWRLPPAPATQLAGARRADDLSLVFQNFEYGAPHTIKHFFALPPQYHSYGPAIHRARLDSMYYTLFQST